MCSIGDLKNNLRILQSEARQMKYTGEFDIDGLTKGNPHAVLPLYHHAFNSFNSQFTTEVMELIDDSLYMKSDVRFMEAVYRVLRDMFHFKPSMTKEQFFTMNNFAERKIIMCVEVLRLVHSRCRFMGPKGPTNPNIKVTPIVNTRRFKKSTTDLVVSEPRSARVVDAARSAPDLSVNRKVAKGNNTKPMTSLMGIDENGWQVKVGYLQPCRDRAKGDKSGRKMEGGVVASMVREFSPSDVGGKGSAVEGIHVPRTDKQEKGHMRVMDALPKAHSEWDPTGAVECILAKVRDLPAQLTSFMKAVDTRLKKIEERLEKVEGGGAGRCEDPSQDKHSMDTLQARLLLLENRLTLAESKSPGAEFPEGGKVMVDCNKTIATLDTGKKGLEEKKTAGDFSPGPYVSLERGGGRMSLLSSEDLFSGSLVMSSFSPIHQHRGDFFTLNSNDTLTSLPAQDSRRLSSTPNQSPLSSRPESTQSPFDDTPQSTQSPLETRPQSTPSLVSSKPVSSQSPLSTKPPPSPSLSSARPPTKDSNSISSSPAGESEHEKRAAAAVSAATADSTLVWETLDTSTQQQVERIRDMLKATQGLLPSLGGHQQQVDT